MKTTILGFLVSLFVFAGELSAAAPSTTAFVDVTVLPMDTERTLANQTVLVRGDRIVAVGPAAEVQVPTDAQRIDGGAGS